MRFLTCLNECAFLSNRRQVSKLSGMTVNLHRNKKGAKRNGLFIQNPYPPTLSINLVFNL